MTDGELFKALAKDDMDISQDRFDKILLDLEILGLLRTTWLTKDVRRIEVIEAEQDVKAETEEYEASFPGNGS